MVLYSVLHNSKGFNPSLGSGCSKLPGGDTTTASMSPGLGNVSQDVGIMPIKGCLMLSQSRDLRMGAGGSLSVGADASRGQRPPVDSSTGSCSGTLLLSSPDSKSGASVQPSGMSTASRALGTSTTGNLLEAASQSWDFAYDWSRGRLGSLPEDGNLSSTAAAAGSTSKSR